jgi:hypothetical protein
VVIDREWEDVQEINTSIFIVNNNILGMNKEDFIEIIKNKKSAPFLFLGSGFTKHYLNTPTWEELLSFFTEKHINAYYTQLQTKDLSKIASQIAIEYNNLFWKNPRDEKYNNIEEKQVIENSTVLKHLISKKFKEYSIAYLPKKFENEIQLLESLNIDGIITTNWDVFIERIFIKYKVYIGQKQLFSSPICNIGEIYKIHGCITKPESLILTEEDYKGYNQKNAYLAAKLITIFVEHPIFFMGYSISDPNIQEILDSIVNCLDEEGLQKLKSNLFFVEWKPENSPDIQIENYELKMSNSKLLPAIRIKTHSYKPIYECLKYFEREIPAHVLRMYKEQFYHIVYSEKPEKQLCVLNENEIERNKDIEFVVGFGALEKYNSAVGYTGLSSLDILRDVLENKSHYNAQQIMIKTIPKLSKNTKNVPYYKYLKEIGFNSDEEFKENKLGLNQDLKKGDFFTTKYSLPHNLNKKTVEEIINENEAWKAAIFIPHMKNIKKEDLDKIQTLCKENLDYFIKKKTPNYSTHFRKLICFYDWKKYGW